MSNIVAGDNGTAFEIIVKDDAGVVDLATVISVEAHFIRPDKTTFDKILSVSDAALGTCNTTLISEDVSVVGRYSYQVTVTFSDESEFTSDPPTKFSVNRKQ